MNPRPSELVATIDADEECLLILIWDFSKCEVFSPQGSTLFPPVVKSSILPNLSILRLPIGDYLHCSHFIAEKSSNAKVLLSALVDVAAVDLHVVASLLRICDSYCHLARTTPPSVSYDSLQLDIASLLAYIAVILDDHWQQAQLSLSFGGLGFQSISSLIYY